MFTVTNMISITFTQMHNLMEEVVNSGLDQRLVNHLFLHLAKYLDAYISNSFLKSASSHVNLDKAIHMKMFVSYLENWFDESGIQVYEPSKIKGEEDQKLSLFPYSRQFADASILSDISLLSDEAFRNTVAPALSTKQIGYLFANFINEKFVPYLFVTCYSFDKKKLTQEMLKNIPKSVDQLYITCTVEMKKYLEGKTIVNSDVFDYQGKLVIEDFALHVLPTKLSQKKELKFLLSYVV